MHQPDPNTRRLNVRVPDSTLRQLAELCALLNERRFGGPTWTTSAVVRAAVSDLHRSLTSGAL